MEALVWSFRTFDTVTLATPVVVSLAIAFFFFQSDFILLLTRHFARIALGRGDGFHQAGQGERPTGLVVIPSLLRDRDDLAAITMTVESCATNGYPSELVIIASVDGVTEAPALYRELEASVAARHDASHVHVYTTGTKTRLGKMMAVEAGVAHMSRLVAEGRHAAFPALYFSIDGDGTLSANALERLAHRLTTPHPITGNLRRVVSGKISIRYDLVWQGWRKFFTVSGQIHNQVAREFVVSNVARFNWKPTPQIGIPGALYCTWSDVIRQAPHYMGFLKQLRMRDVVRWWLGYGAPKFSESNAPAMPEALTGASDDTCIAFIASLASWQDGVLSFDAPATPLHAIGRYLKGQFFERSHDYEPEAKVFTFTPSTAKGLWKQRVRWNASRVECAGRFWRAFWFHWEIGMPTSSHLILVLHTVFSVGFYYLFLPYFCFGTSHALFGFALGYLGQTIAYAMYTLMGLVLETDRRQCWKVVLSVPLAAAYSIVVNAFGCIVGVVKDIFLFGNTTNFAPEWTLAKGGCERIALAFRTRRFVALSLRALIHGDVPFGSFWLGWHETPWTPNGFEGWTSGKAPRSIVGWPSFGSKKRAVSVAAEIVPLPRADAPSLALPEVDFPATSRAA